MKKTFCDKCGKGILEDGPFLKRFPLHIEMRYEGGYYLAEIDLCPDCVDLFFQLMGWAKMKKDGGAC